MKNLSLGLNIVLLAAVAALFVLHFKGDNKSEDVQVVSNRAESSVVYINTDSLFSKYKMAVDLNEAFFKKTEERRADLGLKAKAFEKDYIEFQKKMQSGAYLTRSREEAAGRALEQQKISLDKLQQEMSENTVRERNDMSKKLFDAVSEYLKEYNKEHNYNVILSTTLGGTVLHAKEGLDITNDVVKGLNERYKKK